jgi:hypothetical protein
MPQGGIAMEHLLNMFGGGGEGEPEEEAPIQTGIRQTGSGGGGTSGGGAPGGNWEFEMPPEGLPQRGGGQQGGAQQGPPEPSFNIPGGIPPEAVDIHEETVEGYFNNLGWQFEKIDQGLWILKFKGGAKDYDIFVEVTSQFLIMVVAVLERVRDTCKEKLWYHLLRTNYLTTQLRFGLNKRDEVLLTLEMPVSLISYLEFQKGLQYLCNTVDDAYPELLYLSQKTDALSSFLKDAGGSPGQGPAM